jgi:alkylation response protein AidB-like acyl-CoA dehydrogenase
MPMNESPLLAARQLAEELLFPTAIATDAAGRVPEENLRALADAGLFGLVGPRAHGGLEQGPSVLADVVEALASGCLATTFVWIQHHGAVHALAGSANTALARAWLPALCAGQRRSGLALSGIRPGQRQLLARPTDGGWLLEGSAPWVTGWTLVDAVLTLARSPDEQTLSLLIDASPSASLVAAPVQLVATNASRNVELHFHSHFVPHARLVQSTPYAPPSAHDGGGRSNGSLALGVVRRACQLIGPSRLDEELSERRQQLDDADEYSLASARAAAVELALRASAASIVSAGSRSVASDAHPQRLAREASFLLAFGSRPAIKSALLDRLGASSR